MNQISINNKRIRVSTNISNIQFDITGYCGQLKWIADNCLCSKYVYDMKYASVKRPDGNKSHTYFISSLKDGTFFLRTVEYGPQGDIEQISQSYNTIEEAEISANNHYLNYLKTVKHIV